MAIERRYIYEYKEFIFSARNNARSWWMDG
jgi:hypothetical protein